MYKAHPNMKLHHFLGLKCVNVYFCGRAYIFIGTKCLTNGPYNVQINVLNFTKHQSDQKNAFGVQSGSYVSPQQEDTGEIWSGYEWEELTTCSSFSVVTSMV